MKYTGMLLAVKDMDNVIRRFISIGMDVEEIAKVTMYPVSNIKTLK